MVIFLRAAIFDLPLGGYIGGTADNPLCSFSGVHAYGAGAWTHVVACPVTRSAGPPSAGCTGFEKKVKTDRCRAPTR
jgi:hypothetical protein